MSSGAPPSYAARNLLMVRPATFGPNAQTAGSNAFQQPVAGGDAVLRGLAQQEFDDLVIALRATGANPVVVADTATPEKPDAVFPNNWVSFHEDGSVILYPMEAPNRRPERRRDVLTQLASLGLLRLDRLLDLSALEQRGLFLEGTGSLVMDHRSGRAYAALSSRTHVDAVAEFTRRTGMDVLTFHTADGAGRPLYHTNVMLSIGARFAVVCAEVIAVAAEREALLRELAATGRDIVEISAAQMRDFAANILESRRWRRPQRDRHVGPGQAGADGGSGPAPAVLRRLGGGADPDHRAGWWRQRALHDRGAVLIAAWMTIIPGWR